MIITAQNAAIFDYAVIVCNYYRMNYGDFSKYIWQHSEWPNWTFDLVALAPLLSKVNLERGRLLGAIQALGFKSAEEASLRVLTNEVVKSSEIEGEKLNADAVRSSIARRLGLSIGGLVPSDQHVDGVVEMLIDATRNHIKPLTEERLFDWHAALFPTGRSGMHKITVAAYRNDEDGPMQVVSGGIGREKVHYEAPPAHVIPSEMQIFLDWSNHTQALDPLLKAGLSHLWFVTLHPFDDGNGRIGRAVGDMALSRADQSSQRFYSLSGQLHREREAYYDHLEQAQKGTLDVTAWLNWFLECLLRAVLHAHDELKGALHLANISQRAPHGAFNQRQMMMLYKLTHEFEGKLTSGKWAKLTKCSTDTALRDMNELVEMRVLIKVGDSKRATHYVLS